MTGRLKQSVLCSLLFFLGKAALSQNVCPPNIDFELGTFQNWQCFAGTVALIGNENVLTLSPTAPANNRHAIITPTTVPAMDPYGNFPKSCPNGSGYSIKLGNNLTSRQAERVSYTFTIPAGQNEFSLVYQYAVVLQDPSHTVQEQPKFTARVFDVTSGEYIQCASFEFIATAGIPGFIPSPQYSNVWFKPWSPVTINLSGHAGKTVRLEFTTSDCTQGAHFGYAYIDVNMGCTSPLSGLSYCPGETDVTLNGPVGYQEYTWYDENVSQALGSQIDFTISSVPSESTTYALDLVPYPGFGCRDTVYATITPKSSPLAEAGADHSICAGESIHIGSDAVNGMIYQWAGAGLNDASIAKPLASPATTTNYILTVTDATTGCTKNDTVTVEVFEPPAPVFTLNGSHEQCLEGNSFDFINNNPSGYSYEWDFGDGNKLIGQNALHQYEEPGTYLVKLISGTPAGCTDSTEQTVTIYNNPVSEFTSTGLVICEGWQVTLNATGGAEYSWLRDGVLISTTTNGTYETDVPGIYSVQVKDVQGCYSSMDLPITLEYIQKPVADFSFDTYCVDMPTHFTNNSGIENCGTIQYAWNFGNGSHSEEKEPEIVFLSEGDYPVQLKIIPEQCPQLESSIQKIITVKTPVAGINYTPVNAVSGKNLPLTARNIGTEYKWMPSDFLSSSNHSSPYFNGDKEQEYQIEILNSSGCITVDTLLVRIFKEHNILLPKAFTPNGDGMNDRMFPFLVGIKELKIFRIINRWGVVVFESKTGMPGWDGTYRGKPQPMDGYVWEAQAIDTDGNMITKNGTFTLIR